jgi:Fur family zinc uptake transcriptional regulator
MTSLNEPTKHNHHHCISRALNAAEQLCAQRGVQFTPLRKQVFELVWADHKAVKAYDLLERIKPQQSSAKPATVYRALDFLAEQGFIHRVESLNAFIGCDYMHQPHEQLLLICNSCQNVEERKAAPVMESIAAELYEAAFVAHQKAIEIKGLCQHCSTQHPSTLPPTLA